MSKISFILTQKVKDEITKSLVKYGDFEIGGVLVARKIESNSFEIIDISVADEDKRFSISSFIRGTTKSERLLKKHFKNKSGYYAGEWHSHPRFSLEPSRTDILTMLNILNDSDYGVSFVILLIVHLQDSKLKYKGYFFHKDQKEIIVLE